MGVKATLRHSNVIHDASDSSIIDQDHPPGTKAGATNLASRVLERQPPPRRKVDSVLDDIMGDPDDFRDLADSDAESDGGRWEDAVRAALEHEEAGVGAVHPEIRDSEAVLSKASSGEFNVKQANETINSHCNHCLHSPSSAGDPGFSEQNGEGRQQEAQESEGPKHCAYPTRVSSGSRDSKVYTRYFIIKSLNHHNIAKSIEKGIWATQAMNEPVLNDAFESSERVLLVFSVNMSGHFQGYAQMTSQIGRRRANVWSEANEGANPWGGTFSVDWLRLHDLPFQKTVHLKNPLNFFKPVKISRDCQELTQEVGDALCDLIDEGADREGRPKRKVTAADLAAFSSKRKRKESVGPPNEGSQSRQQASAGQNGATRFPATYPPHFPPRDGHGPFSSPGSMGRCTRGQASYPLEAHKVSKSKSTHSRPQRSLDQERDKDRESKHRERERPLERDRFRDCTRSSSSSHSADLPGEEDLLNMTYEEYLQRHGHSRDFKNGFQQGTGPFFYNSSSPGYGGSWIGRNAGMGFAEDQYSNYISNWYSRQGPPVGGDALHSTNGVRATYPVMHPPDTHRLGQTENVREWRHGRSAYENSGPGYGDHNERASRHTEGITEAGS